MFPFRHEMYATISLDLCYLSCFRLCCFYFFYVLLTEFVTVMYYQHMFQSKLFLFFPPRNYTPLTDSLSSSVLPSAAPGDVESLVQEQLEGARMGATHAPVVCLNFIYLFYVFYFLSNSNSKVNRIIQSQFRQQSQQNNVIMNNSSWRGPGRAPHTPLW